MRLRLSPNVRMRREEATCRFELRSSTPGLRHLASFRSSAVAILATKDSNRKLPEFDAPQGYDLRAEREGSEIRASTGRAAHAGMNIENGRNALVLLARTLQPFVQRNGAADLLAFAAEAAGSDLHGGGLGMNESNPLWGRNGRECRHHQGTRSWRAETHDRNIRAIPGLANTKLRDHLAQRLQQFNTRTGARLSMGEGSFTGFSAELRPAIEDRSTIARVVS